MSWPALRYEQWQATCDTLHAHTQVLGKLAARLAPPEPQLQHAAFTHVHPAASLRSPMLTSEKRGHGRRAGAAEQRRCEHVGDQPGGAGNLSPQCP